MANDTNPPALVLVPGAEQSKELSAIAARLVPLLDEGARQLYERSKSLPAGAVNVAETLATLAAISAAFLGYVQEKLQAVENSTKADVVESYLGVLLPMLAKLSPRVIEIEDGSKAFEGFVNKEFAVPEGAIRH